MPDPIDSVAADTTWREYRTRTKCRKVEFGEQTTGGTVDFRISSPSDTAKYREYQTGQIAEIIPAADRTGFAEGELVFQYRTVSGSATFVGKEN